ncbi:hypothetical protein [Rubrivivax gelatinosus]|uniref:hypothetical protein n=1 Tax=Rubrivivax gelatinosus TaxID=28068 RepID=UPI0019070917|nr:hypothetical protein [Rubrivivax gelatinosus]
MTTALTLQRSQGLRTATNPLFALPGVEHLFSGSPVVLAAPTHADDKQNGSGDSAGRATNVKARGGNDARQSRDAG